MIDVIHKIHTEEHDPYSLFGQVTVDSIMNHALHIGYHAPNQKIVVYASEVDRLIEILTELKEKHLS